MKAYCEGLELNDAVLKVIKAASNKTTNPILEGIKIVAQGDELTFLCTDGELAIERKIKADIKMEGETVVPGKFFSEYVKKLTNEQVELELNEKNQLKLKYTDSEMFVQCLNVLEFPNIQKIDNAEHFVITQKNLKDAIDKTIFSVALDDSRPILKGCFFEINEDKLISVALDGYRLAKCVKPIKETTAKTSVIIPGRSLNEISKLLNDTDEFVKVYIQRNFLMISEGGTKIITRLFEGDFINYNQIIPNNFTTEVTINKSQLEEALDRASILSRVSNDNTVKFVIKENVLTLSSKSDIGNVTENLSISTSGNDLTISFDSRYFKDCLKVVNEDFIKMCFTTSINPCIIKNTKENEDYLFLILPLKTLY